ncbi:hypothetical protein D9758_016349 [Tetrapyrgos nigripes]|uniref:Uncharacterized protein n=1 Tax=Tetrapyrgos nigripes TaxID=182062 RepID=A0A8H5BYP3_9AGAR|nr:hypothetical protein D9758_016349 [Tetrapyrgos nigripes]
MQPFHHHYTLSRQGYPLKRSPGVLSAGGLEEGFGHNFGIRDESSRREGTVAGTWSDEDDAGVSVFFSRPLPHNTALTFLLQVQIRPKCPAFRWYPDPRLATLFWGLSSIIRPRNRQACSCFAKRTLAATTNANVLPNGRSSVEYFKLRDAATARPLWLLVAYTATLTRRRIILLEPELTMKPRT